VFGSAEGLKELVIVSIAQDADGFLWVGGPEIEVRR